MEWTRTIELLSPTFCRGAYQDTPEIRAPSIRGMVRWWFRALNAPPDGSGGGRHAWQKVWQEEKDIFGGVADGASASRLVFRVLHVGNTTLTQQPTLPHKPSPGQRSPQAAFDAGGSFALQVTSRLRPLSEAQAHKIVNALEVWVLLGSLGLRSNRAGGSLWPEAAHAPKTPGELRQRLDAYGCRWPVYLAGTQVGTTLDALRAAATDTVPEPQWVFGSARHERLASPLKFKIVRLDAQLRLLITAPDERIITEARRALHGHRSKPEGWSRLEPAPTPDAASRTPTHPQP